jgi:hypothetical protein
MAILWFGKATKLENFKVKDLRKERLIQEVQQDQLVTRMRHAQDEHDGILAAAAEPGLGDGELDVAAYKMDQASKRKSKAEADLQQVLTRLQVIDSTMDILDQKKELQERGIWKKINDLDEDKLEEQLEKFAVERKQSHLNINKISEMLEVAPVDVKGKRSAGFRASRQAIEALRSQQ